MRFVESIADGDDDAVTRKAFEQSAFNTPALHKVLQHHSELDKDITYTRQSYPPERLGSMGNTPALARPASAPLTAREKSFVLSTIGPNSPLLLVNTHSVEQLAAAAHYLSEQKRINPKQPL